MIVKTSFIASLLLLATRGHACDDAEDAVVSTMTNTNTISATTLITMTRSAGNAAPSAASAAGPAGTGCLLYTVSAQQTGFEIAKLFGLEFPALNASNPGIVWTKLEAGSQILIPAGSTMQPSALVAPAPGCTPPPSVPEDAATNTGSPATVAAAKLSASQVAPVSVSVAPSAAAVSAPVVQASAPNSAAAPSAAVPSAAAAAPSANAAAAAAQPATAATSGCKTYTVKAKDTGYEIAQAAGITIEELKAQNPGMVWEKMQVGQVLTLPPKATGASLGASADCKPAAIVAAPAGGAVESAAPTADATVMRGSTPASGASMAAGAASGSAQASAPQSVVAAASSPVSAAASATAVAAKGQAIGRLGAEPVSALIHMGAVADCGKSADPKYKDECTTAQDASGPIIKGFTKYKISTPGEQAALLSLMIFESAGFKYSRKHYPTDVPGQGTANMMSWTYVQEYLQEVGVDAGVIAITTPEDTLTQLLKNPTYSFATAAWFYNKHCSENVKKGLRAGTVPGYNAYLKDCVGTDATPERIGSYAKARAALGLSGA